MFGVIVTCHGECATGLYSTLKLVAGEMENVRCCNFLMGEGIEEISSKIKSAICELETKNYEGILVLTDIAGGTPFNQAVLLSQDKENIEVLSGANFVMLYTAAISEGKIDDVVQNVLEDAKKSITKFNFVKKEENDEIDGI